MAMKGWPSPWLIQRRRGLRFSLEARQCLGISGDVVRQKFQSDKPMQGYILSLVNHTHPAAAELLDNPVVRNGLPNHRYS
jgi:hypothetical protein